MPGSLHSDATRSEPLTRLHSWAWSLSDVASAPGFGSVEKLRRAKVLTGTEKQWGICTCPVYQYLMSREKEVSNIQTVRTLGKTHLKALLGVS